MRMLPITLSLGALLVVSACHGTQPGAHHAESEPRVLVARTYDTTPTTRYVTPVSTSTYIDANGNVVRQQQVVTPQAVIVEPRTATLVEERRYYNDDYVGRGNSQAERQALSRKHYDSCPPGAAKERAC